jgi:hypothetical protein
MLDIDENIYYLVAAALGCFWIAHKLKDITKQAVNAPSGEQEKLMHVAEQMGTPFETIEQLVVSDPLDDVIQLNQRYLRNLKKQ